MYFKFPLLLSMLLAVFYPNEGFDTAVAAILCFYAISFYWLIAQVLVGNRELELSLYAPLSKLWQVRVVAIGSLAMLYFYNNIGAFYFALPFVGIGLACDIIITLISVGFLEYSEEEDTDIED
jgi:hypothetical protein